MTEWQPMETAPKPPEGSQKYYGPEMEQKYWLLGWDGKHLAIISWNDYWWNEHSTGQWEVIHDAERYTWNEYEPTHWMPLPEPPKE